MNELDCDIYVKADVDYYHLIAEIEELIDKKSNKYDNIVLPEVEISIEENSDYNEWLSEDLKKDFLHFPYSICIYSSEEQVSLSTKILEYLWSKGYEAVAASGYDEKLPRNGGMTKENSGAYDF